jgi:hypothetical protein
MVERKLSSFVVVFLEVGPVFKFRIIENMRMRQSKKKKSTKSQKGLFLDRFSNTLSESVHHRPRHRQRHKMQNTFACEALHAKNERFYCLNLKSSMLQ